MTGRATDASDALLAQLVDGLVQSLRAGRFPDIDELIAAHPELAGELRELWPALLLAEGLGSQAARLARGEIVLAEDFAERAADGPRGSSADSPTIELPRPGDAAAPSDDADAAAGSGLSAGTLPREFGDYELIAELGRGGMGVVYLARQRSLHRHVAIKMLLRREIASADDLARFQAEPTSAARLDHPQIVPVYEVGQWQGQPYFSMKYVEGKTLADRLAEGPLSSREAAQLLAPICRAIHYAHERGVLHRDLKPSNILLDRDGRPHVTDFGLAKRLSTDDTLTGTGMIVGTPSYMAPEQAAGNRGQIGPASDVYGLGTILYQAVTGRPPFQAASAVDTVLMVLEQDPLPPRLFNAKVDRDLELVVLRCLQKPIDLRYPTAAALADDLEAYLAGEPVAARSGGFSQVVGRLFRETHHATVLENWGLLWMWHSVVLLVICLATNWMQWRGVRSPWPYLALWTVGLGTWAAIFWALRRRAGPVTFVERQIAHIWASSVICSTLLFGVEVVLGMPVLALAPVLALVAGIDFFIKAGILSGAFYVQAAALFATAFLMAWFPSVAHTIFGMVAGVSFFVPGLKYYRQRRRGG
ncbi:MAG: serine/threonine-protein kinase [Pirellulales bacterium]